MKTSPNMFVLFFIIFLEGYIVLASELISMRLIVPFVGNGTDTVAIIIAAVLMPLAFGYYAGGQYKKKLKARRGKRSIRDKLVLNMVLALVVYLPGLSYVFVKWFFGELMSAGIENRLLLTAIYAGVFLVTPVYLLGQTIPLISHYFSKEKLAEITGKVLFISTMGSFLGAVFTTLVLMSFLGVHMTSALVLVALCGLITVLNTKRRALLTVFSVALALAGLALNSNKTMQANDIVANNQYNMIAVKEVDGQRHMMLNGNSSSKFDDFGNKHSYIAFVEDQVIFDILDAQPPKNILVIGAGAFTFGSEDTNNIYDYVDIDPSLQAMAEEHILQRALSDNKTFHALPARGFLSKTETLYDVVFIDVFQGDLNAPEHLVTQEFFQQVQERMKDGGLVFANFTISPNFKNRYSRVLDNTWHSVFPYTSRHIMLKQYVPWNQSEETISNVIYMSQKDARDAKSVYTDNLNRSFMDRPKKKQTTY